MREFSSGLCFGLLLWFSLVQGRRGTIPFEWHKFRVISPRAHLINLEKCSISVAICYSVLQCATVQYLYSNEKGMTRLRTQREVSEYFGKNPNDRSFISRNIKKGKIIKDNGGYTIVDYKEDIKSVASSNEVDLDKVVYDLKKEVHDLQKEVERLRKENKELKEKSEQKSDKKEDGLLDIDNLKYLMDMLQRRNKFIQAVIKDFFDSHPGQYDREGAIAEVYKKYNFEENPTDDDEIMYILELISDNEKN